MNGIRGAFSVERCVGPVAVAAGLCVGGVAMGQCEQWASGPIGPSPRQNHGMVFDGQTQACLLFGGFRGGVGFNNETWLWNGASWFQPVLSAAPSPRGNFGLSYDSRARCTFLFGGAVQGSPGTVPDGETWQWDGGAWVNLSPPTSPAARYNHAMAYDEARQVTVMFGGWTGARAGDTWIFDGQNWAQVFPPTSPVARSSHAMAYDSVRHRVVLFGGFTGAWRNDTWEWDGTTWTQSPAIGPSGRQYLGMSFDSHRGVMVLACGQQASFVRADDTWEYDGVSWTEQKAVGNVGIRDQHVLAYDPVRRETVLHGGYAGGANVLSDLWLLRCSTSCYPDCDTTTGPGVLDIFDFLCFGNRFSSNDPYACDCDSSTGVGVCDIFDFLCFGNAFSAGCP